MTTATVNIDEELLAAAKQATGLEDPDQFFDLASWEIHEEATCQEDHGAKGAYPLGRQSVGHEAWPNTRGGALQSGVWPASRTSAMNTTVKVEVELPEEMLMTANIPQEGASREITRLAVFEMYREGPVSLGKTCELAGIGMWEFFEIDKGLGIPLNHDLDEWQRGRETAQKMPQ